jgi:protein-S-isoprenylcysteine O-methyltransferase Ste14
MDRSHWRWDNVPVPEAHLAALGAAILASLLLPARLPLGRRIANLLGLPTMAGGSGLAAWAVSSASASEVGVDRPSKLVTTGAFAVSRNPMYQGWSIAIAGLGIATRSPWVLAAAALASAATHREILDEEAALTRRFGDEFAVYVDATPRYLLSGGLAGLVVRVARMIRGTR